MFRKMLRGQHFLQGITPYAEANTNAILLFTEFRWQFLCKPTQSNRFRYLKSTAKNHTKPHTPVFINLSDWYRNTQCQRMYLAILLSKFNESCKSLVSCLIHSYNILIRSAE